MESTGKRLLQGAALYRKEFAEKTKKAMEKTPQVVYPDKVERRYFQRVDDLGHGEFALVFLVRTFYKKIERYQQANNQKYPIYSDTLCKEKTEEIKIRPNPLLFEEWKEGDNPVLAKNALGIISYFLDPGLYPVYAQETFLEYVHLAKIEEINKENKAKVEEAEIAFKKAKTAKADGECAIQMCVVSEQRLREQIRECLEKAIQLGFHKHKVIASVSSLGLRRPSSKSVKFQKKAASLQVELTDIMKRHAGLLPKQKELALTYAKTKNERNRIVADAEMKEATERAQYEMDRGNVKAFFRDVPPSEGPTPPVYKEVEPNDIQTDLVSLFPKDPNRDAFYFPDDPFFLQYSGLAVVGILVLDNQDSGEFHVALTFDVAASLYRLTKRYKDATLLKEERESTQEEGRLYKVRFFPFGSKEMLADQFEKIRADYGATIVVV